MNDEYKKMLERFEQICQNAKKELCGEKEKQQEKRFIERIDKELTISEYDEIEYWLANVEVLNNTDYILNNRKAKILVRYLKEKQQEIERLNNKLKEIQENLKNMLIINVDNDKEIERLKGIIEGEENLYQKASDDKEILKIENRRLKNIIKEAIEYIENNKDKAMPTWSGGDYDYEICLFEEDIKELLEILQGSDKE